MKRLKKIITTVLLLILVFSLYVMYVNRNAVNMTPKQKILKTVYPAWMWLTKLSDKNSTVLKNETVQPVVSIYSLKATRIDGSGFDFSVLKGKKILLVNTASDCGYTDQYADLEKLYNQYKEQLEILAFPANDFKEQENGSDEKIAEFCKKNYAISFSIMAKSTVVRSSGQNAVFNWLTDPARNGWNSKAPSWNFSKYLVNEKGQLTHYFDPGISPLSSTMINAIKEN